jgi:ectoine hydroxylase-related dioxygenase (phytanoyl-CoA dioxygenase family)
MTTVPMFHAEDPQLESFYVENGFAMIEGLWTAQECDGIIQLAKSFPGRATTDFRPLMQPQRTASEFLSAIRNRRVIRVVEHFLGCTASGLQIEFFFGHPGTKGFARHQDNFYVEAGSQAFLSIWSAMTDVTPAMGGLVVYPGSHKFGRLPTRALAGDSGPNQDPNANNEEAVLPQSIAQEGLRVSIPRGAVVLLHADVVHSSLTNQSDRFRYALLCTYLRKGTAFRPGRSAKREEIDLHAAA